jgi:hypothetical protein
MNDPVVTIRETEFGNLYTKIRDIRESDLKIINNFPDELSLDDCDKDSYISSFFEISIFCEFIEESLLNFNKESGWKKSGYRVFNKSSFYSDYKSFDWRGCRTISGKVSKFNRNVVEAIDKVMSNYERKIKDGISNVNKGLESVIKAKNDSTFRSAKKTYLNISQYDKNWLNKIDDPDSISKLDSLKEEYKSTKERISNLEEEIRIRRVEEVKKSLQSDDCKKDPKIVEFLLNEMNDKSALANSCFDPFYR